MTITVCGGAWPASSSAIASRHDISVRGFSARTTLRPSMPSVHATRRSSVVRPDPRSPFTTSELPALERACGSGQLLAEGVDADDRPRGVAFFLFRELRR